jgi:hypothetical protein
MRPCQIGRTKVFNRKTSFLFPASRLKSSVAFTALLAFAILNTGFLGYYFYSQSTLVGSLSANTTTTSIQDQVSSASTTYAVSGTITTPASQASTSTNTVTTETGTTTSLSSQPTTAISSTITATETSTTGYSLANTTSEASSGESTSASSTATTTTGVTTSAATVTGTQSLTSNSPSLTKTQTSVSTSTSGAAFGLPSGSPAAVGGFALLTSATASTAAFFVQHSLILAPGSWFAVGGMWIWRGRMRARWTDLGFDSDVFTLFVRMKGAKTRIRLLDALSEPKDRLQLAQELGLDWKSVDRHVAVMKKYGFLNDELAYGRVRMYRLTPMGVSLLKLLQELSKEEKSGPPEIQAPIEGQA